MGGASPGIRAPRPVPTDARATAAIKEQDMADTTFDAAIERDLQKRYRQPNGVEQFGIEAVPESRKTVKWYDLFSIILNFLVNPATILRGGLGVAAGLSFRGSLLAEVCGIVIAAYLGDRAAEHQWANHRDCVAVPAGQAIAQ